MNLKKNIIVLFLLIFVISSCKAIDRKIDNLSLEEEKNLSRMLGKQQIELINEFGKPNDVIHNDDEKILIFTTKKYNITCERKFTIDSKGVISGFSSRNCF